MKRNENMTGASVRSAQATLTIQPRQVPPARTIFATGTPDEYGKTLCTGGESTADQPDWWSEPDPDHEDNGAGDAEPSAPAAPVQVPGPEVKYLDAHQAAAYLNVGPRFIRRLVEERRVTVRKVGKFSRFTREDLDAAVAIQPPIDATTAKRIASKVNEDDPVAMVVKRSLSNTPNKAHLGIVKEK